MQPLKHISAADRLKRISGILLVIAALTAPAAAQEGTAVTSVRFEGVTHTRLRTLKNRVKHHTGSIVSDKLLRDDVRSLKELGYFESVDSSVDPATGALVFRVKEKPFIKKVTVKGSRQFTADQLTGVLALREGGFYDAERLEQAKRQILSLYHDQGFTDCTLDAYPVLDDAMNEMTVTFLIVEGTVTRVGSFTLNGNDSFCRSTLAALAKTRPGAVYREDILDADIARMRQYYRDRGYLDVSFTKPVLRPTADGTATDIFIRVAEGPRYRVKNVSFAGDLLKPRDLKKAARLSSGDVYSEEKITESVAALGALYADHGYLQAQVTPSTIADPKTGRMDVVFTVAQGTQMRLGEVTVRGLTSAAPSVLRRELLIRDGEIFSRKKYTRGIERMYELGFIESITPQIKQGKLPSRVDLQLDVVEGRPGTIAYGAGYSAVDQYLATLRIEYANLFGRAQKLSLQGEYAGRKQHVELGWTEPWFLGQRITLGITGFATERLNDYSITTNAATNEYTTILDAYKERRQGGTMRFGPRFGDFTNLVLSYSYEDIEVFEIKPAAAGSVDPSRDITSSITTQLVYDDRDNVFDATRGCRQSAAMQVAGGMLGGGVNFVKPTLRSSWYFPLWTGFTFSLNGTFSKIEAFRTADDVPLYERFKVGGGETVRGYRYGSEIGPADGGKIMAVFNAEFRFPIIRRKSSSMSLYGVFFADAGGAWLNADEIYYSFGETDRNFKAGAGAGLRLSTPVFPIRFDWGYGLNHRPGEDLNQYYLTIGNAF